MNRKILYGVLVIFIMVSVIFLSGCSKKQDTIIEEISLYTGSTSVNNRYSFEDGTLSVDMYRCGEKKSKKKKLSEKQIKNIEKIISKYELQTGDIPREDEDRDGSYIAYFSITLKNDSNVYKSVKDGFLVNELSKYFEEILDI